MNNFASIFQQFRNPSTSQLADLLQQPSITIQKLLDEDCFLSQYRTNNKQLLQFLTYQKYKKLVEFVTIVGPQSQKDRSYKYPFLAVDILSLANNQCLQFFLPDKPIFIHENIYQQIQVEVQQTNSLCSQTSFRSSIGQHENLQHFQAAQAFKYQQINQKAHDEQQAIKNIIEDDKPMLTINQNCKSKNVQNQNDDTNNKTKQNNVFNKFQSNNLDDLSRQISPDDFPDTFNPKKIVKKKQVIKKTVEKQVKPLIQELFDYFYQQVNYTLAGYVSKILFSFIQKKKDQFFTRFFNYKSNSMKKPSPVYIQMLQHIQSKSVSQLIVKILTSETDSQEQQKQKSQKQYKQYYNQKEQMIWVMINSISIDSNLHALSETGSTLVQVIVKISNNAIQVTKGNIHDTNIKIETISNRVKNVLLKIFDIDFLKKLIQITLSDLQINAGVSGGILYAYLKNIDPPTKQKAQQLIQFQKLIYEITEKGILKILGQLIDKQQSPKKKKKIQTLNQNLKQINQDYFNTIPSQNTCLCLNIIKIFEKYPLNNIVHNQLYKIIQAILNPCQNKNGINNAILNLLDPKCLYKTLHQALKKKKQIGYFGHCVKIANKLQDIHATNFTLNQFLQNQKWRKLLTEYLQVKSDLYQSSLGGYKSRKQYRCQVMFQKNDILLKFDTFLKGQGGKQLNMDDFDFPQKSQASSVDKEALKQREKQDFELFPLQITQKDHKKYLFNNQQQQAINPTISQINSYNKSVNTSEINENALKQIQENNQKVKDSIQSEINFKSVFGQYQNQNSNQKDQELKKDSQNSKA